MAVGEEIESSIKNNLRDAITGAQSFGEAMTNVLNRIRDKIIDAQLEKLIGGFGENFGKCASGGGGNGSANDPGVAAHAGSANSGGGGGGGGAASGRCAGAGGSGIVVVRGPSSVTFEVTPGTNSSTTHSPTGEKIATFTVTGTLTVS